MEIFKKKKDQYVLSKQINVKSFILLIILFKIYNISI